MTINITCVDHDGDTDTDTDIPAVNNKASCETGLRFSGDIHVAGHKVGSLEDRDGMPVFTFNNGEKRKLVVVPRFMITNGS